MKRIGLKSLAIVLFRGFREGSRPSVIDHDGGHDNYKAPDIGIYMGRPGEKTTDCFPNYPGTGKNKQDCFRKGRDVFKLSMPEMMILVRGSIRNRNSYIGDKRGN
jgi:hypothetical protein